MALQGFVREKQGLFRKGVYVSVGGMHLQLVNSLTS